ARADQLAFWDGELVNAGAYVVMRRLETVARLARLGHEAHRDLAAQRELLEIGYRSTVPAGDLPPEGDLDARLEAVAASFREALGAALPRELQVGASVVGPHPAGPTLPVRGRRLRAL